MRVLYANADVFTAEKRADLLARIDDGEFHVVALTEIFPKSGADRNICESLLSFDGYEIFWPGPGLGGRGLAFLVRRDIPAWVEELGFRESSLLKLNFKGEIFAVGLFYRSPVTRIFRCSLLL